MILTPRLCPVVAALFLSPLLFAAPIPPGTDAEIQAALNALPETGGRVELASGVFRINRPVVMARDNQELVGQGPSTILLLADKANCPVLIAGETNSVPRRIHRGIRIADLFIDGNKEAQKWECWGGECDKGGVSVIRNNGVTLRGVTDTRVERVTVVRPRSSGLCTEKECRRLTVTDFTASHSFFDGLAGYQTEDSVFTRLQLYRNKSAGLSFDIAFNHNLVTDSVLADNGSQGVFMRDSRDNLFQGLSIRNSGEQGIFIAQVEFQPALHASGNTFDGLVISGSRGPGIRINDITCVNNSLSDSRLFDNKEGPVSEVVPGLLRTHGVTGR